jgi:hypothetical protein
VPALNRRFARLSGSIGDFYRHQSPQKSRTKKRHIRRWSLPTTPNSPERAANRFAATTLGQETLVGES